MKLHLYRICAVMARATFDGVNSRIRYEFEYFFGFKSNILNSQVARNVIIAEAQRMPKRSVEQSGLVPKHQVFERIENCIYDPLYLSILGKH